jgi:S1-C subfamily serine protease
MFMLGLLVVALVGTGAVWLLRRESGPSTPSRTACSGGVLNGPAVLECLSESVAYIETAMASGSGVLLEGGYVVTNAHVVDPFNEADVTFDGGDHHTRVPVVGVDLFADLAVLGPIETTRQGRDLVRPHALQKGDPLFLVGFPGETDKSPDPAISQGVFSKSRHDDTFDLTFLQTDATIAGGQSGGALADEHGQVIGISGYSFAEGFALALDGADAARTVEKVRAGNGTAHTPIPSEGTTDDTVLTIDSAKNGYRAVIIPARNVERTVRVDEYVSTDIPMVASDLSGKPLALNRAAIDSGLAFGTSFGSSSGFRPPMDLPPDGGSMLSELPADISSDELSSISADYSSYASQFLDDLGLPPVDASLPTGSIQFVLPVDTIAVVAVAYADHGLPATDVGLHASEKFAVLPDANAARRISVGDSVDGVLEGFHASVPYEILLKEGDVIDVRVTSPTHDMAYTVVAPGQDSYNATEVDNSNEGIGGLDPHDTYTAKKDGVYTIDVHTYEETAAAFRVFVTMA